MRGTKLVSVGGLYASLCMIAWGGQSLVISTADIETDRVPAQGVGRPCRVEWSLHDWSSALRDHSQPIRPYACGIDLQMLNFGRDDIRLQFYHTRSAGPSYDLCLFNLYPLPSRFATIRYQHIPNTSGPGGVDTCEAWDVQGTRFHFSTHPWASTSGENASGAALNGTGQALSTAYFRMFSTTVSPGSRPPVTADVGDLLEWRFEGNLRDSSPRNANGSSSGGSVSYAPTPGQDLVVAVLRTADAPAWSNWISLRAGFPNTLDCSNSYSQSDQSAQVECTWSSAGGPSMPTFSSTTGQKPVIEGLVFGSYPVNLTVRDVTGKTVSSDFSLGAVPYNDDGAVTPSDSRITDLFGPMIAFGQNPWGYADERAKRMVELQYAYFTKSGLNPPSWATQAQGTVTYPFGGIGAYPGPAGTTLTADLTGGSQTIEIQDASKLPGLRDLPSWFAIGPAWRQQELVRVCSTTATTGPAQLTVCYDGRGLSSLYGKPQSNAQAWPRGTIVGEYRISGTGTRFVSDSQRPICPGGAPGPPGPVLYEQGRVNITGNRMIVGQATSWDEKSVPVDSFIRIEATHGGGTPFVYWSRITGRPAPQELEVLRPIPDDIDAGPFPYRIIGYRFVSLEFTAPDGTLHNGLQFSAGCESETAMFAIAFADVSGIGKNVMSDVHFSSKDSLGAKSTFGPNFYGSGLAARALYLRSGWDLAKKTADIMDEYWVRDPEVAGGWYGGIPLTLGGGVVGAIADLVTNPDTRLTWDDVRPFVQTATGVTSMACDYIDTRDSGYFGAWLTLAALFDPTPQRWQTVLPALLAREQNCQRPDHSWSNGFIFNGSGPALTVTPGSSVVTGANFTPGMCFGIASGFVAVNQGSPIIRGTGLVDGAKIVLSGTRAGAPFVGSYEFKQTNGSSGTLAVLWPGDSGTVSFLVENHVYLSTIATKSDDDLLKRNWACTYVSPSEIRLNRPWDGPALSNAHLYSNFPSGYGQQPFMLGIKTAGLYWGQRNSNVSLAAEFGVLATNAATWIHDVGFDPTTKGMYYGRIFEGCEPETVATTSPLFDYRTPGCSYGLSPDGVRTARALNAETSQAIRLYYEADPSPTRQQWGDLAYGAVWGYCPYTKPGFYCDPLYVRDENSDLGLSAYKWPGFFFGMGMAHQWPAARLKTSPSPNVRRR